MKHLTRLLLTASIAVASLYTQAQLGIGTDTPAASAQLEVTSESKGVLIPRMTSTNRTGISNPAEGLLVYQTDSPSGFYYRSGSTWVRLVNSNETVAPVSPSLYVANRSGSSIWAVTDGTNIPLGSSYNKISNNLAIANAENTEFQLTASGRYLVSYKIALYSPQLFRSFVKVNNLPIPPSVIAAVFSRDEYISSFIFDLAAGDTISLCLESNFKEAYFSGAENTYLSLVKLE